MRKFLNWSVEFLSRRSKKPWARFITNGISEDGQVKFDMAWNKAFLNNIAQYGFVGESDEISVQHFLMGSIMIPAELLNDEEEVTSTAHPHLQDEKNKFLEG